MPRGSFTSFDVEVTFSREATDLLLAASSEFRKVLRQRAVALAKKPEAGAERTLREGKEHVTVGVEEVRQVLAEMGLEYLV
jgi:hypothetical protein